MKENWTFPWFCWYLNPFCSQGSSYVSGLTLRLRRGGKGTEWDANVGASRVFSGRAASTNTFRIKGDLCYKPDGVWVSGSDVQVPEEKVGIPDDVETLLNISAHLKVVFRSFGFFLNEPTLQLWACLYPFGVALVLPWRVLQYKRKLMCNCWVFPWNFYMIYENCIRTLFLYISDFK